jgi:membrane protease YdiL (CAAX protease family)
MEPTVAGSSEALVDDSRMSRTDPIKNWPVLHGFVFLLAFLCTEAVPWPWPWLAQWSPLIAYFVIVGCIPSLRGSMEWLKIGRITLATSAVTLALIAVVMTVLFLIPQARFPREFEQVLPIPTVCGVVVSGALFALINSTVQELVFRGILFDSLESMWGRWAAILVSAFVFGLVHLPTMGSSIRGEGFASLAMDFGVALGFLRAWSGGLMLPIVAHIAADVTIVYRAMHAEMV